MSLINKRLLGVCAASVLAVGVPYWLLRPQSVEIAELLPIPATRFSLAPVAGLDMAIVSPPFTPSRQPVATGDSTTQALPEAVPTPAPAPPTPPQLVGLVVATRGKAVALLRGATGQTVTLSPGEAIDGWKLVRVSRDEAVLEIGGVRHAVALDFSNRAPAGGAPALPSPPPIPNLQPAPVGPPSGTDQEN